MGYRQTWQAPAQTGAFILLYFLLCGSAFGVDVVRVISVKMGDYRFQPDTIEVHAGEPVRLELTDTDGLTPHNFTLKGDAGKLDIDIDVAAGTTQVVEFTAPVAGSYPFFCNKKLLFMQSHRDRGMQGTLVVQSADPR